jgi:hypothetical protein
MSLWRRLGQAAMRPSRRLASAVCIGIAVYNLVHIGLFFTGDWQWAVNDDVRQNLFFMERARDGSLFPNDLLAKHARAFQPIGFYWLVWAVTWCVGIITATKVIALATTAVTLVMVAYVAFRFFGWLSPLSWFTIALLTGHLPLWALAAEGLARGVVPPLSLLALIALRNSGDRLFLLAIVLAGLFAPTLLVFLIVLTGWKLIVAHTAALDVARGDIIRRWVLFGVTIVAATAITAVWQEFTTRDLGLRADYDAVRATPPFERGGRWFEEAIAHPRTELLRFARQVFSFPTRLSVLFLAAVLIPATVAGARRVWRRRSDPPSAASDALVVGACFVFAGAICWIVARAVALTLYFPIRYLIPSEYGVLIALVGLVGLLGRGDHPSQRWAAVLIAAVMLHGNLLRAHDDQFKAFTIRIPPQERPLYEFLRTLPKNALIAGNPWTMDNVPLLSKRSVLVNHESSLPLYPEYYRQIERRTVALIDAYFGWSPDSFLDLSQVMGVSHLVITRADFTGAVPWSPKPGRPGAYIQPFRSQINHRLASRPPELRWAWQMSDWQSVVFRNESFLVIDVRRGVGDRSSAGIRKN